MTSNEKLKKAYAVIKWYAEGKALSVLTGECPFPIEDTDYIGFKSETGDYRIDLGKTARDFLKEYPEDVD